MAEPLPLLLEPEQFATERVQHDQLLLIDVSSPDNYRNGHIPGALHLPPGALQCGIPPVPGKLPAADRLTEIFSKLGLTPEHHVVAYDDEGGGWAARLLWTLEAMGHEHYSYLNGGIHAWRAAGLEIEHDIGKPAPSAYKASIHTAPIAEFEDILPRLDDPALGLWDARSAAEYRGEKSAAARAGHVPGAINIDWLELIDRQNGTRLVNLEVLRARLQSLGLGPDKDIVTYCQSHHRSSLTWLAMKILGYPSVKGYHGSWGEWGNLAELPIEP